MAEYIIIHVLCWVGAGTIFGFAFRIEEFIMQKLTGAGMVETLCRILKEFRKE
ncbi:MAG: hypothetical protein NC416_18615 [Eubacterium sp.]|nr:hypothetical protein [Eubacterium sp.]